MASQPKTKTKKKLRKRLPHEKKPILPGVKSMRGKGEIYDETKKPNSFAITPTAHTGLKEINSEFKIPQSELIELIGRKKFIITKVSPENE